MLIVGEEVPHTPARRPVNTPGELSFSHVDPNPAAPELDAAADAIRAELRAMGATGVSD
jgi:hypothetical protein